MSNFKVKEFPPEVINEIGYYVYRLVDPSNGATFYVGKGTGNRIFDHINASLKLEDEEETEDDLKIRKIREIKKSGLDVIHIIHRHGLDSSTALHVEAALMDAYPGITNIAGGHGNSEIGSMNAYEILQKYKAEVADLKHKVIMININRSANNMEVYDAVRFAWKLDVKRAERAEYVLAVEKGLIVGVFKPREWHKARKNYFPEFSNHTNKRYGFIGDEAEKEIQDFYLRKRIPDEFRKRGAANPIKYNY
ncbi:LEM-3-like GIY-YIG domain-containing protein [Ornithobacterium rhinotracheale]|uniref:LEM-3-like GIY-YIG domain-containing protein n=1 Tax=Ornithobacterium rhinotracheale TaxID=28251 RepID=UPI001FF42804|nr:excinuclease ABC [Ornithobacterium rhinotracheale]MCK0206323.1 excinuclease ABC [Ornithobacterium rhinotracheale]